ncbi:hypothetical protein MYX84_05825 [Acidobacteria bacterium AH-259-O06]|nr:hypothetical protein [Acidobacteria bacterium AH-259-O06]
MRAVKLILLFTVLGVRVSLGALQVDQAQEWLTKGNQLIAEGHFSEAVAEAVALATNVSVFMKRGTKEAGLRMIALLGLVI